MKLQYVGSVILLEALWEKSRTPTSTREGWLRSLVRLMRRTKE